MGGPVAPGTWFVVGEYGDDELLFKVPVFAEGRDFGGPIGQCIKAARVSTENLEDKLDAAEGALKVGALEWVRLATITTRFKSEEEVIDYLFPFRDGEDAVEAGRAGG